MPSIANRFSGYWYPLQRGNVPPNAILRLSQLFYTDMGNKHAHEELPAETATPQTPEVRNRKLLDPRSPDQKRTPILEGESAADDPGSPYQPPRKQKKVLPKRFPQEDKENRNVN